MSLESLISDIQAEQFASVKIVTKIQSDAKVLEENKALFEDIVGQLSGKDNAKNSKFNHINLGGDIVALNSNSVEHHVCGNYLFALLSDKYCHLLPKDKNGRVFLDLDVRWVEPQLNWLRDMPMWNGAKKSIPKLSGVHAVLVRGYEIISRYFQSEHHMTSLDQIETDWLSAQSDILRDLPQSNEAIRTMIHSDSDCILTAKLLYRSSRDGLTTESFHEHCDGHKNTLCVIRDSDGGIFGGFTGNVAWETVDSKTYFEFVKAPNAFLFSLVRDNVFEPVKCSASSAGSLRSYFVNSDVLFAFGNVDFDMYSDLYVTSSPCSCHCDGLGGGFECEDKGKFPDGKFHLLELEVFEIAFIHTVSKSIISGVDIGAVSKTLTKLLPQSQCVDQDKDGVPSEFVAHLQCQLAVNSKIVDLIEGIRLEMQQLCDHAMSVLNELKFVANFVGITLPVVAHKDEEDSVSDMSELEKTLNEIQPFVKLLTVDRAETSNGDVVVSSDASSIVYINAGGRKIATTKVTLLQAPSGSILANMASDVWGHDLDSEGNIFQDVNPDLFTAIINHLRLKALLPASEVPPITVYEEQTAALDNLLVFYMIGDVKVEFIKAPPLLRVRYR